jgi:hypothetical protein
MTVKFLYNSGSVTWHMGPQAKISSSRSGRGRPVVLFILGSFYGWILTCLAWLPHFPSWGWHGGPTLPSAPAYRLWLTGEGAGLSDRWCLIPSHCRGWYGLWLPFCGVQDPPKMVIYFGVDHLGPWLTGSFMENPPKMFSWWSHYVRWRRDGYQLSSACH